MDIMRILSEIKNQNKMLKKELGNLKADVEYLMSLTRKRLF